MTEPQEETGSDAVGAGATLLEVLNTLRERGYDEQLIPQDDGSFRCPACDTTTPASALDVVGFQRLEGASDPDDMNIVVWASCPGCGANGVATIGFGPNAGDADQAVLEEINFENVATKDDGNADA